jgi:hypothetical protein
MLLWLRGAVAVVISCNKMKPRSVRERISRVVFLLAVHCWASSAFQAARDVRGDQVLYQGETIIATISGAGGKPVAEMSASAGTIAD